MFKTKKFKPYGKINAKKRKNKFIKLLVISLIIALGFTYMYLQIEKALNSLIVIPAEVNINFERPVIREVTAYSEFDSCHYPNCAMASGARAYVGAIACPRSIKLGSKVKIAGKWYVCEDRTALSLDGRFDIFMGYGQSSYDKAIQFGKQLLPVVVR